MIRVDESRGKGRGVFATQPIARGALIEEAPVVVVPQDQIPHVAATVLDGYCFLWGEDEKELAIALGRCSLCNHSYEPNAEFTLRLAERTIAFVALSDIRAGDEIVMNYNGSPASRTPVWFPVVP